ncbi:MAG TPA: tetratricopeptide repeat protein [Pseudonocardiaceae bacterium]|nr:tetratricopeptide repeat protein [Pseudonocardiaceae bacterium]
MIITLVVVALACLAGLAVLRPFAAGRSGALHADADPDEDLRHGLLRQLRDLDNDLAVGKLSEEEHRALRAPVETEAISVLRRIDKRVGSGELTTGLREIRPATKPEPVSPRKRRLRIVVGVAAGAVVVGGAVVLLTGTVTARQSGATITGGVAAKAAPSTANGASNSASAAIGAAEAQVNQHPKDVTAHLNLADAYLAGGKTDQAAIEYLAVNALQPGNAAANTGLAVIAYEGGKTTDALQIVNQVLAAQPKYPEALYTRGMIELLGQGKTAPAKKDLDSYLAAAPFGAHKQTVQSLLAMIAEAPSK